MKHPIAELHDKFNSSGKAFLVDECLGGEKGADDNAKGVDNLRQDSRSLAVDSCL